MSGAKKHVLPKADGLELWLDVRAHLLLFHSCQLCSSHLINCCDKGTWNYIAAGRTLYLDEKMFWVVFSLSVSSYILIIIKHKNIIIIAKYIINAIGQTAAHLAVSCQCGQDCVQPFC